MHVLSKEEYEQLQAESNVAQLKANLKKAVQMVGTSQQMPVLPQRAPPTTMREWEVQEGAKQDAHEDELREQRRITSSQPAPAQPPQQRLRTTTTKVEEYQVPGVQQPAPGGQVQQEEMATPTYAPSKPEYQGSASGYGSESFNRPSRPKIEGIVNQSIPRKEELGTSGGRYDAQTEGRISPMFGGVSGRMEESPAVPNLGLSSGHTTGDHVVADPKVQEAMRDYFSAFARKREQIEAATPIPEPDEGASPYGESGMEAVDAVNQNPSGKISQVPGQSGSSGVYRLNAGHPDLEKGFTKMNRVSQTYCRDCGVCVDDEGDEAHFKKSGHAHFRKI